MLCCTVDLLLPLIKVIAAQRINLSLWFRSLRHSGYTAPFVSDRCHCCTVDILLSLIEVTAAHWLHCSLCFRSFMYSICNDLSDWGHCCTMDTQIQLWHLAKYYKLLWSLSKKSDVWWVRPMNFAMTSGCFSFHLKYR